VLEDRDPDACLLSDLADILTYDLSRPDEELPDGIRERLALRRAVVQGIDAVRGLPPTTRLSTWRRWLEGEASSETREALSQSGRTRLDALIAVLPKAERGIIPLEALPPLAVVMYETGVAFDRVGTLFAPPPEEGHEFQQRAHELASRSVFSEPNGVLPHGREYSTYAARVRHELEGLLAQLGDPESSEPVPTPERESPIGD
jgi:hypothetical protein